jgi:hypothetical protein
MIREQKSDRKGSILKYRPDGYFAAEIENGLNNGLTFDRVAVRFHVIFTDVASGIGHEAFRGDDGPHLGREMASPCDDLIT